ncbi:hypothetical protein [Streptomyces avicenniae]|uniref:hypothetical protein n=1 Tax=Streptomyces avicenniae TaxID=500153 RepID=UPI000A9277A7|nr:hypothetical protein [Streptomyces avicenniae]
MPERPSNAYGIHHAPWRSAAGPVREDPDQALYLAPRWQTHTASDQAARPEDERPETD